MATEAHGEICKTDPCQSCARLERARRIGARIAAQEFTRRSRRKAAGGVLRNLEVHIEEDKLAALIARGARAAMGPGAPADSTSPELDALYRLVSALGRPHNTEARDALRSEYEIALQVLREAGISR